MPKSDFSDNKDAEVQSWEVPLSLPDGNYIAHLREPASRSLMGILRQLQSRKYANPFVLEDGRHRQLHLGMQYIQSRMALKSPDALCFDYTREMMSFLLFNPRPKQMLIIGLGGGSSAKFCFRQLPRTRITAIESNQAVIGFAPLFCLPRQSSRFKIVHADGAQYVREGGISSDVIYLDACNKSGVAAAFRTASFYENARTILSSAGVLTVNLVGSKRRVAELNRLIGRVFEGRTLALPGIKEENQILLAFQPAAWPPDWPAIRARAKGLEHRHTLAFNQYSKRLEKSARASEVRKSVRAKKSPA